MTSTSLRLVLVALLVPAAAFAQTDPAALSQGWSLLAQGQADKASAIAAEQMTREPRSAAAIALGVEAAVAQRGAVGGLDTYERWLGARTVDAPYVLRRVAVATLFEIARSDREAARRIEAIEALTADGGADVEALTAAAQLSPIPDLSLRAAAGSREAMASLEKQLQQPGPARHAAIAALGRTRNPRAVRPLVAALADPDPIIRAAAAQALGAAGSAEAIPALKPLLKDQMFNVKFAAAASLLALGDESGRPFIRGMLESEHAGVRLAGARATRDQADASWLEVVRELARQQDPDVRRQAGELLAPHDPELARATLEPLLNDPNPALRQAAADAYVGHVTDDFSVLRRYLRGSDAGTRVRAADRILRLTR